MHVRRSSFVLGIGATTVGLFTTPADARTHPAMAAIAAALATLADALKRGDGVAAGSIFSPDAVLLVPGDFVRGREAIAARYTKRLATRTYLEAAFTTLDVTGTGDLAVETGTSRFSISEVGAPAKVSTGRYLTAWRSGPGGVWTIETDAPIADPVVG